MWVAAATYCAILAPKGLLATLIGVLGMAHFSLGRGSGSFFGGFLIGNVGTREAFRYMGLMAVLGGVLYYGLHLVYLKKFDIIDEKDEEPAENGEADKLTEPKTRDQGTSMSQERLSLWVKYNQIGSLASLPRGSKVGFFNQYFFYFCLIPWPYSGSLQCDIIISHCEIQNIFFLEDITCLSNTVSNMMFIRKREKDV